MGAFAVAVAFALSASCGGGGVPVQAKLSDAEESEKPKSDLGPLTPEEAWLARRGGVDERGEGTGTLHEVRQRGTGLSWLRCPVGQRFHGGTCRGGKKTIREMGLGGACPKGYRVPTVEEIILLLGDCDHQAGRVESGTCRSCYDSPVCSEMFGDDVGWYWSNAAFMAHSAQQGTWSVSFEHGYVHFVPLGEDKSAMLRCVRSGRAVPSP